MRFDDVDARVDDQFEDTVELPRTCTPRVSLDKMSSDRKLMPIQCHATLNVLRRLRLGLLESFQPFRIVVMYIFIEFLRMTKSCARGGAYDNKGYRRLYEFPNAIPIRSEAEAPTVRKVERGAWQ